VRYAYALLALVTLAVAAPAGIGQLTPAMNVLSAGNLPSTSAGADGMVADRVEEDWKIIIANPDVDAIGPQFTTCMNPTTDDTSPFVAFDMNYSEYPRFTAGGMQVQVWSGDDVVATAGYGDAQFETPGEMITWTQSMRVKNGQIAYLVKNGSSTTWGQFGAQTGNGIDGQAALTVTYSTDRSDLSGYSADYSASRSGATWQSDHVTQMTLVQVRYYAGDQLIKTDTNPRNIILSSSSSNASGSDDKGE
jgi:hypothetical protein